MESFQLPNPDRSNTYQGFFEPKIQGEDYPLKIDLSQNEKYTTLENLFTKFFKDDSLLVSKYLSKQERTKKPQFSSNDFIYGEVTFESLAYIFEFIKAKYQIIPGKFIDLGSGSGKAVLIAAFCHPFQAYIGVELLESLYKQSLLIPKQYYDFFPDYLDDYPEFMPKYDTIIKKKEGVGNKNINDNVEEEEDEGDIIILPEMKMVNIDFMKIPLKGMSFVFINSTSFSDKLMHDISKKCCVECQVGCIVVTFTKKLIGLGYSWIIVGGFKRCMSWGLASVYIHIKTQ